ncbi:MAG: hypothetical protein HY402_00210, partial [Elusimicrobia bacterium]|nr:hypothetical protein [Elusimicrobiota bacterium]
MKIKSQLWGGFMNFWTLVFLFGFGLGSAHSQQFFEGWVLGNFPVLSRLEEFPALTQDWDRTRTVLSSFFRNDPFLSQRPDVWIRYEGGGARGEMILVPFLTLLTQDGEALAQFFQGKDLFSPEQEVLAQVKARALGAYDQLTADLAFAESADRPEIQQGRQGVAQLGNPSPDFDGSGEGSEETFHPGHVGLGFL